MCSGTAVSVGYNEVLEWTVLRSSSWCRLPLRLSTCRGNSSSGSGSGSVSAVVLDTAARTASGAGSWLSICSVASVPV